MSNWMKWAKELQALAQAGCYYTENAFDLERYERIRAISHEMFDQLTDASAEEIAMVFSQEEGYQTPKIDTRAVIWQGDKILLVKERNQQWALPGGWMDITESLASNCEKESLEEAGAKVHADRLLFIETSHANDTFFTVVKVFVECQLETLDFQANSETSDCAFFALDDLPDLSIYRTSADHLAKCLEAKQAGSDWQVSFD
ncbi:MULTISPECIES: NUDIX hydrolase N-terminal domain-containing protein [Aerococcus]|uniref:NUDIX domain-containing protein n=1 Tax=Aerococcus sanguinicola TaxID=119206 RepID=A0A5N1GMC0_9LACT|nr:MULTISPECIES: NUDIX hydrolase N-terminal domain-containing protein [Aerococcus]KAA9302125.1 NUDIX domain-containing protein [Aerococcus sanguinicola]MDK6368445.1 NUDIX hydrolase N-terminal domain-containing protein [Aerococcus sp. UMB9870]MDK6679528.1 NUDIX hydrolase N-terminal domain-containing protein [Aerococcus sp. UMB8608]MDK6686372.1 NUDIX hydrolase N-terminal domain-containing protein [Aerococcus sp. UMB8623]MDK6941006.1 NUDIX hydrolase N-terminal domain-containing protein [Aerococcu